MTQTTISPTTSADIKLGGTSAVNQHGTAADAQTRGSSLTTIFLMLRRSPGPLGASGSLPIMAGRALENSPAYRVATLADGAPND